MHVIKIPITPTLMIISQTFRIAMHHVGPMVHMPNSSLTSYFLQTDLIKYCRYSSRVTLQVSFSIPRYSDMQNISVNIHYLGESPLVSVSVDLNLFSFIAMETVRGHRDRDSLQFITLPNDLLF